MGDPPDKKDKESNNLFFLIDKTKKLKNITPGPKFLTITRVESEENLTNVSAFLIKKVIDNVCNGEIASCKKLRDGSLLIKTNNTSQAKQLIQLTGFTQQIKVEVKEHQTLNNSKGVVYSNELRGLSEETIASELKDQNVTEAKKNIKKTK